MLTLDSTKQRATGPRRFSYAFIAAVFVLAGWLHLGGPFVVTLFAFLALTKLCFLKRGGKALALVLFFLFIAAAVYAFAYFIHLAVRQLPDIADRAIPSIIDWAQNHQIELPFTDYDSLKTAGAEMIRKQASYLGGAARFARGATEQFIFAVAGCAVAIGLFLNPRFELGGRAAAPGNLYSLTCSEIEERFRTFYQSFTTVMGAQVVIAAINTVLTAIGLIAMGIPYVPVLVGLTFFWGLVPIVGNLISGTIIVGMALSVSPLKALIALGFLLFIHKLEYFLNTRIVGQRIRTPFWLTMVGLVLGERLMGVPGMILAPVILNYLKLEASNLPARTENEEEASGE
ncbi:MAG: hypothetical protein C5B50_26845 [Verrucomicrobia bacterium]|nr:MAG: hypothetical protein C5B50_26845 [Verrucomicrobiota bacterium]